MIHLNNPSRCEGKKLGTGSKRSKSGTTTPLEAHASLSHKEPRFLTTLAETSPKGGYLEQEDPTEVVCFLRSAPVIM